MSKSIVLVLLSVLLLFASGAYSEECLHYDPEEVEISGVIAMKTFPGPPEYESIEEGDKPETVWILNLLSPICVLADEEDELINVTEKDIRAIHLVLDGKQYKKYGHLVSKKVIATGKLYHSHTGHHHTDVLMIVLGLKEVQE